MYNREKNVLFSLTPLMFWFQDETSSTSSLREIDLYLFDSPKLKMNSIAFKSVQPREELAAVQGGDLDGPYRTILDMRQQDPVVPMHTNVAITRRNGP